MRKSYWCILLMLHLTVLSGATQCSEDIAFTLNNPSFSEGVLTTEEGGVIEGPCFRLQAMQITVSYNETKTVLAEDKIILEYGNFILVGDLLEYDLDTGTGRLYNGRSVIEPWYFGGKEIILHPDYSIDVVEGYLTTSDKREPEWRIQSAYSHVNANRYFTARDLTVRIGDYPIFWFPKMCTNLDMILDSPIRYRIRWGGKQGLRVGMLYELFTWRKVKTFLRFDYRLERGPGGGFENHYESADHRKKFHTINYIARDSSIEDPRQRTRYRFEGYYYNQWEEGRQSVLLSYDKLSDEDMATDYQDKGLVIKDAYRTRFNYRKQYNELFISNFFTQLRINDFETVKQSLPAFTGYLKPIRFPYSGIIAESMFRLGHLDFVYAEDDPSIPDYNSTRFEFRERLYRPFSNCYLTVTPEVGGIAIFYNNSPLREQQWATVGIVSTEIKSNVFRVYCNCKHIIEPYTRYQYITRPTSTPNDHYIFDITDGLFRLNTLRYGVRNLLFCQYDPCYLAPTLSLDTYVYSFFDTPTQKQSIPRIYTDLEWNPNPRWKTVFRGAWDLERGNIGYSNLLNSLTLSENLAFTLEFRHRNAFAWRKVDPDNFILESFRTEEQLRNSLESDRRNTLLWHIFYRPEPNWAAEFQIRHGWHRMTEPNYTEYQFNLFTTLRSQWKMRLSYEKKENDHRVAVYFTLGRPVSGDTSKVFLSNPY